MQKTRGVATTTRKATVICLALAMQLSSSLAANAQDMVDVVIDPRCIFPFSDTRTAEGKVENIGRPFTFKDKRTQVVLYVESDGRHLAATDSGGKLLWVRNPFEEAKLCPYRHARPVISQFEQTNLPRDYEHTYGAPLMAKFMALGMDPSHTFLMLHFSSSQYGLLDESNGSFLALGQN